MCVCVFLGRKLRIRHIYTSWGHERDEKNHIEPPLIFAAKRNVNLPVLVPIILIRRQKKKKKIYIKTKRHCNFSPGVIVTTVIRK